MTNFKLRGKCKGCRKVKWFVRKRTVKLPIGMLANSKDLFCTQCFNKVTNYFNGKETK